jgi:replicative DNA helicase
MSAPEFPSTSNYPTPSDPLRDDAADLAETAQTDLAELGEEVKHQAAALGEEAKAQIGEVAEKAKGLAAEQKDLISGQLSGVSDALQKVAGELEQQDQSSAHYIRMVADGARKLTSTVRDNDVDQILSMAQDFGRKQPAAFMGLAAVLGFAASRFALASASRVGANSQATAVHTGDGTASPSYAQSVGGEDAGI